ncbi:MAG: D-glycerate dehydrogenase [Firmicutes bacterium]|nr:D-glycerate dehydrogenase [Bacillota bacterium]
MTNTEQRPKVFVTRLIPEAGMQLLRESCDVEVNPEDRVLSREELIAGVKEADALLCLLTDTIDEELLAVNPNLKVVSNYAVGYNNIDVQAATKRGIPVCNTPGVLTDATADTAWALLMAAARRVVEADRFVREGKFKGWGPMLMLGADVTGKTLGLVGMGRIGQAMAQRATGFEMKILYYDVQRYPEAEEKYGAVYRPLEELLAESDFVSLHVPLLPSTHHIIGEKELELMKPSAILVNSARGPLIDEAALVKALQERKIAAAGLDVFENEPELAEGLAELDNVVLLPHLGSATYDTRDRMAVLAANNLLAVLRNESPAHCVNPEVLQK